MKPRITCQSVRGLPLLHLRVIPDFVSRKTIGYFALPIPLDTLLNLHSTQLDSMLTGKPWQTYHSFTPI